MNYVVKAEKKTYAVKVVSILRGNRTQLKQDTVVEGAKGAESVGGVASADEVAKRWPAAL